MDGHKHSTSYTVTATGQRVEFKKTNKHMHTCTYCRS